MTTGTTTNAMGNGEYAEVGDINLYYETHGTGRPLILVHGGLASGEMFGPILPTLMERRQVILPDLQGHGRTLTSIARSTEACAMAAGWAKAARRAGMLSRSCPA